jgi:hypothetical protein
MISSTCDIYKKKLNSYIQKKINQNKLCAQYNDILDRAQLLMQSFSNKATLLLGRSHRFKNSTVVITICIHNLFLYFYRNSDTESENSSKMKCRREILMKKRIDFNVAYNNGMDINPNTHDNDICVNMVIKVCT